MKENMKNSKGTKHQVPTFLMGSIKDETEGNFLYPLDLPLFYTTSEQREIMNKAAVKADAIEKKLSIKHEIVRKVIVRRQNSLITLCRLTN
ncbi:hypothetical protein KO527_11670 [Pseudoalteromonas sp. C2R02]|uniref:hypothetical protein n=1 Tax=Pseudoalteromonas sp. C2R02 TaxID=2841565 RepID=UPI001C09166C|nr:hypothetical protein [Pseudoalteromonas sp. C2R02]MBU2970009.1 hypothetical protein [Pseudoalteromonas sp. C2R02]